MVKPFWKELSLNLKKERERERNVAMCNGFENFGKFFKKNHRPINTNNFHMFAKAGTIAACFRKLIKYSEIN
jgi:hypothetical protein